MNTRYSVRNDYQLVASSKPSLKASQSEVLHDLQQMTDEPIKNIIRKQPRETEVSDTRSRSKVNFSQRISSRANEIMSAALGFASFLNELEHCKPLESPAKKPKPQPKTQPKPQPKPKLKPAPAPKPAPKPKTQSKAQTDNRPPFLVTQPSQRPLSLNQLQQSQWPESYMNMMARMQIPYNFQPRRAPSQPPPLPASAIHVKIARFIDSTRKSQGLSK